MQQDKQDCRLTIEEYEHFIIFRNDVDRYYNPRETVLQIAVRVQNGEKVEIENPQIYNLIDLKACKH